MIQIEDFKQEEIQQTHWRFWGIAEKGRGTQKDKPESWGKVGR